MSGKIIHRRRDIVQISFPNNRRSTRFPRKRVVTRRVWKEEESSSYFGVPSTALSTPFDLPNPLDDAPTLVNHHAIHYSDAGGYAPAQPCPELFGCQPLGPGTPPQFNATEYLTNQFNPFVKENIPPVITSVIWDTKESWGWSWGYPHCEHAWVEIDAYILDVAPYTVVIGVTDRDTYLTFSGTGGQDAQVHHAVIDLDYWGDVIAEYYINVTVWDNASNYAYYEKEVAGILGSFTNFLGDVWNAVCGVFAAAWEAVKAACSFLVEIVKGIVGGIINKLLQPIITAINNWMREVAQIFISASQYTAQGIVDALFDSIFFSPIALAILAVIVGISVAEKITMAMTGGAASALSLITGVVSGAIIGILFASIVEQFTGSTKIQDMVPNWFDDTTDWSFTIAEVIFMLELKQRVLKPIKGVEMSIWLAITSLILLGVGTAITSMGGETGIALKANILLDVFALGIAIYGLKKGVEISGRGANLIKMWYPLLYPIMLILDAIGIATSVYSLITDIIKLVVPDQASNPGGA